MDRCAQHHGVEVHHLNVLASLIASINLIETVDFHACAAANRADPVCRITVVSNKRVPDKHHAGIHLAIRAAIDRSSPNGAIGRLDIASFKSGTGLVVHAGYALARLGIVATMRIGALPP